MVKYVNIKDITPAPYNPRKITEQQIAKLKESLTKIGSVIPILVNENNNTIIAGHQRIQCAKALGFSTVPCFYVKNLVLGDEIKFNQFHNGVELKSTCSIKTTYDCDDEAFAKIDVDKFEFNKDVKFKMNYVKEICKLILKYGNVFCALICKKTIFFGDEYVYACKMLNKPVNAYICNDDKEAVIKKYFFQDYGKYSYEHIKKNTYVQGLAQMNRNTEMNSQIKRQQKSALYEKMVLPYLKTLNDKNMHILDFGCGKGAYIKKLSSEYQAIGLEFFNHDSKNINISLGNKQIDRVAKEK